LVGEGAREVVPVADVELAEHLAQVVGHGAGTDEQLPGDLRVRRSLGREPGDSRLLRGELVASLDAASADLFAGGAQLDASAVRKQLGPERIEDLVGGAKLLAGLVSAPLAPQPFAVQEMRPAQFRDCRRLLQLLDSLAVQPVGIVT